MFLISLKNKIVNTNENNRIILYNTIGAFFVRGGAMVLTLFTMPAYIHYFDNQKILGLWFTILSVLSWILTFDLGIGNGLRNHLVPALTKKDYPQAKIYISSAYVFMSVVVLISICVSTILFKFINWNVFFNISNTIVSRETLNLSVFIVFLGIMLQFLLKLITSILYAMQKSALINLLSLFNSVIVLVYVLLAKTSDISSNLISISFINVLAVNLPLLIASIIIFSTKLKLCRPSIKSFQKKFAKDVMMLGGVFFLTQVTFMLITATNEFLITWFTGSEMVVEYQIYFKLFTLAGFVFTLALTPVWSAVTKAYTERNFVWIKKLNKKLNLLVLLAVVCEFGMIPFLQLGINFWLGHTAIQVNYLHAIVFAMMGSMVIWTVALACIANGIGELKAQIIFWTLGAIIKVPVAWILVIFYGWIGVPIANVIALSFYCVFQPIWLNKFFNNAQKLM